MRIIFVRHGTPDYSTDSLTPVGQREAEALALRTKDWNIEHVYLSPLGRAQETAQPTIQALGLDESQVTTYDWLREFSPRMIDPTTHEEHCLWDLMPEDFTRDPGYMDPDHWFEYGIYKDNPEAEAECQRVYQGIDDIVASYGYQRDGKYFDFVDPSGHVNPAEIEDIMLHGNKNYELRDEDDEKTILIVCHFGVTCVMLGHLLGISPVALWHGTSIPPTGVTVLNAEKRIHNTAHFRMQSLGDTAHLYAAHVPVSGFAAFSPVFQK